MKLGRLTERLWVADEGEAGDGYGGNKVRKLDRILADAERSGATELLTVGGVGSHHVIATAFYGARRGMRTHALLFAQPDTPHVRANARTIDRLCASTTVLAGPVAGAREALAQWLRVRRGTGGAPYLVQVGGSSALGASGWVSGGRELAERVAAGELPRPKRIYVALGTGGTAAGLLVGLAQAGLDAEVVAVRVVSAWVANRVRVVELAERVQLRERRWARLGRVRVDGRFFCGGYGAFDDRIRAAVDQGVERGLPLETTYTGKALAAALADDLADPADAVFVQTAPRQRFDEPGPVPPELEALLLSGR